MPRQYKVVIGIHRTRLRLANNWNVCTQSVSAIFIGVPFCSIVDNSIINTAPLEDGVTLGRGTIDMDLFSFRLEFL